MSRPKWLDLGPREIAELRETPAVQMIMEWLEWEKQQARDLVLFLAAQGQPTSVRAGAAVTFDHILASLKTPAPIAELDDERYADPARRPSRKDSDAEVG